MTHGETVQYWSDVAAALGYKILPFRTYFAHLTLAGMAGFWAGLLGSFFARRAAR